MPVLHVSPVDVNDRLTTEDLLEFRELRDEANDFEDDDYPLDDDDEDQ